MAAITRSQRLPNQDIGLYVTIFTTAHALIHGLGAPMEVAEASDSRSLPSFHFSHYPNQVKRTAWYYRQCAPVEVAETSDSLSLPSFHFTRSSTFENRNADIDAIPHTAMAATTIQVWLPRQDTGIGAQKCEDLREFDDVVYPTRKDACFARGLLEDDKEYIDGIIEASLRLYGEDVASFSARRFTFRKNQTQSSRNIVNMPYPDCEFTMEGYNCLVYDELDYKISDLILQHRALYAALTNEKKVIYETIVDAAENNKGGMFFDYGYGGTGKTFLYKTLTAALRSKRQIVINVASSGIASLLLDGGRTAHSRFVIPINVVEDSLCTITADSDLADLIRETKLIIWDEAPMINRLAFEAIDRTLRDIATGTQMLIRFLALLLMESLHRCVGSNPADVEEINDFAQWILNTGEGKIVYDDWEQNMFDPTYFQDKAILAPTHEQVDKVNNRMMAMLPGREKVCYSSDTVTDVDIDFNYSEALYTTEFLNSIRMSGIPHHKLVLKVGAPVMCMRNIDQRGGLCNGTRLQILRMAVNNIEAKIISGCKVGFIVAIPWMNISPTDKKMPFQLDRRQFPVQVCFAMTINKVKAKLCL
ncbi:ATP-dependent DNA helicase PIF1-like protein, partial [Tanacetum coccineum]